MSTNDTANTALVAELHNPATMTLPYLLNCTGNAAACVAIVATAVHGKAVQVPDVVTPGSVAPLTARVATAAA
jgi:hypothetical protein